MQIKINNHGTDYVPEKTPTGDMYDLATAEDVHIYKGESARISLGISMELPSGYHAKVYPRSSTYSKWNIVMTNSVGIIDSSYAGDNDIWQFPALALADTMIPKGTRIAQFEICKNEELVEFIPVKHLGNADRGGFGSSGD